MSRQTLTATVPLSPVMTFTAMPSSLSLAIDAPASALGRSTNVRKPASCRSCSSPLSTAASPGTSRVATATTRAPSANRPSSMARARGGDVDAAGEDGLGRALRDEQRRAAVGRSTSTLTSWRSWSNGSSREPPVAASDRGAALSAPARPGTAPDRARCRRPARPRSSSPRCRPARAAAAPVACAPAGSRASSKVMAPSVRVPVLSVNSTSMLPRSSIVTSRLTSTRLRASARDPVDRLTLTIAGSSCGVIPMAIARQNRSASSSGRESATLITKIETVSTAATSPASARSRAGRPGTPSPPGARRARPRSCRMRWRRPSTRPRPAGALVDDGAHERAGRQIDRRVRPATGSVVLAAAIDSPVRTASSHSSWSASNEPHVGRDQIADPQRDDVAGHQRADVDLALAAVPPDQRLVVDVAVQRCDRARGAVLVDEPEPDAQRPRSRR